MATDVFINIPDYGAAGGVSSLNGQTGALTLVAGTNITIVPGAGTLTINSTGGGGSGTVTSLSVVSANGLAGTVANPTTTPAITLSTTVTGLLKGNGTAISAATAGTDYVIPSGSITGTASNITATSNSTLTTLSALSLPGSQVTGNIAGNAANITATSNSTLVTLSALSLPYSQITGAPATLIFADSLVNTGGTVTLVNDSASPTASQYYGTNAGSVLGYHNLPSPGTGTVTSVALTTPGVLYSVSGSPITTSGTLALALISQAQNSVLAGPTSGSGSPSFRALVAADIPSLPYGTGTVTSVSVVSANGFAGTVATSTATPAITLTTTISGLLKGNGTAISAAVAGTDYVIPSGSITGTASNITATSNSTLTTLSALSLPYSQITGAPSAITALTGDGTASGPGSATLTLATVNTSPNTYTNATITVNGKGLVTSASSGTASVTTLGAFGSSPNANAGTISGSTLTLQPASSSFPGGISTTTQSWSGNKTNIGTLAITPSGSTTALTIDSTSFIFDSTNNAFGIGIQPSTTSSIDIINSSGSSKPIQITSYGTGSSNVFRGRFARGTSGSPAAAQSGDLLSVYSGRGYGTSQFASASTGIINIVAGETFTNSSNMTYLQFMTTPTGSVTAVEHMRVSGTGVTLGAQSSSTDLHTINGGWLRTNKTITSSYTVDTTTTDDIIYSNQSAALTITLPSPTSGRTVMVKDISGLAQTYGITMAPHSSEKIEGLSSNKILYTNYGSWTFSSDGTNWWMI